MLQFRFSCGRRSPWPPASGFTRCCLRSRRLAARRLLRAVTGDQQGRQLVDGWLGGASDVHRGQRDNRFRGVSGQRHGRRYAAVAAVATAIASGSSEGAHGDLQKQGLEGPQRGFLGHLGSGFRCSMNSVSASARLATSHLRRIAHFGARTATGADDPGFARGLHHQTPAARVTPAQSRHHRRVLAHVDHRGRPGRAGARVQHHFQLPLQPLVDLFARRSSGSVSPDGISVVDNNGCPKIANSSTSHGARGPASRWCGGWGGRAAVAPPWWPAG